MQKKVLAIHDISCAGRCSLTVALPIISAAGIECSVVPTALLSTHTGGFEGYTFLDLTDEIYPVVSHFKSLGIHFDAIYTGYLGSYAQLQIIERVFEELADENTIRLVDPVMGDGGKLYRNFDKTFVGGMSRLCAKADIIVPNVTEASMMVGREYAEVCSEEYAMELLSALCELGAKKAVLSGVSFSEGTLGAVCLDSEGGGFSSYFSERIEGFYHGTGDVFASTLLAAMLCDRSLEASMRIAADFTLSAIKRTYISGRDRRYGVEFESGLSELGALLLS